MLPSAFCDVLAGAGLALATGHEALAAEFDYGRFSLLLGASGLLYAGGMVWNDVADVERDRELGRQGKPIVAGHVTRAEAAWLALSMHVIALALLVPLGLLGYGVILAAAILLYDFVGTRHAAVGILVLPLCRVLNVGLGMLALLPAWTLLSTSVVFSGIGLALLGYALYVAIAVAHGRLEDRRPEPAQSSLCLIGLAMACPLVSLAGLPEPLYALAAAVPIWISGAMFWRAEAVQGRVVIPARTGLLLRGLARFTTLLAFGSGQWQLGVICALLAYGLPPLLRLSARRWT